MGSYDFAALLNQAKEAGVSGGLLPDMEGEFTAETTNAGATQGGKDQLGILWKCTTGPNAGASGWENITISPESPKAMGFFFRAMAKFGMDDAFFQRQPQPTLTEMAERIKGHTVQMKVSTRTPPAKPGKEPRSFQDWNLVKVISGPGGIPVGAGVQAPAAAPVAAAPAPVAASVAAVPAPAPAPVAAPVAAPVPAAPAVPPGYVLGVDAAGNPAYLPDPALAVPVAAPVAAPVAEAAPAALPARPF